MKPSRSDTRERERSGKSDLFIDVLGTSLFISADEDPVHLEGILKNYRTAVEHIQQSSGLRDPLKIAVLTGFLLCDELQRLIVESEARANETREAEQLALDIIARIDEVLADKA